MFEPKFFRCAHCGNLVGLIEDHGVPMVCCGEPMQRLAPNAAEASHDRHLPYVEIGGDTVTVQVGIEPHEMTQEHHIAWAYLQTVKGGQRKRFTVGEDEVPVAALSASAASRAVRPDVSSTASLISSRFCSAASMASIMASPMSPLPI